MAEAVVAVLTIPPIGSLKWVFAQGVTFAKERRLLPVMSLRKRFMSGLEHLPENFLFAEDVHL
jgi:hypothetical protein